MHGSASGMFVTIQCENIHPSKETKRAITMLKLSDVCSQAINHYVSLSLTNRKSSVHLHALYSPRTALGAFTPRRDQLMICGQYTYTINNEAIKMKGSQHTACGPH
jgi:hypothetical protein